MSLASRGVSFSYTRTTRRSETVAALREVSLEIPDGSLTALLGPNGCGKSTLLKVLSGILSPDEGSVTLDGRPLTSMSRRAIARRIAVVPQETHPAFDYTVLEMVLMGRHPHLGSFRLEGPEDLAIAGEALAATGTAHLAARGFSTLSGGEKQRVVIAGALAQAPDILLLDEPTASLDLGYQFELAGLLRRLNRQRRVTMALATHDLNLAASLCDTVIAMREGQVLARGPTAEVLTPAVIARLYDVDADVRFHHGAGHLMVVPVGRRSAHEGEGSRSGPGGAELRVEGSPAGTVGSETWDRRSGSADRAAGGGDRGSETGTSASGVAERVWRPWP